MKLFPGDKIRFLNLSSDTVLKHFCSNPSGGPPKELLKALGSAQFKQNSGEVVAEYKPTNSSDAYCGHSADQVNPIENHTFYVVRYTDHQGNIMQLGFMDIDLQLTEPKAKPEFRVSYVNNTGEDETVTINASSKEEAINSITNMRTLIYALGG